eukprot:6354107-Prymnesium_polylepis.1
MVGFTASVASFVAQTTAGKTTSPAAPHLARSSASCASDEKSRGKGNVGGSGRAESSLAVAIPRRTRSSAPAAAASSFCALTTACIACRGKVAARRWASGWVGGVRKYADSEPARDARLGALKVAVGLTSRPRRARARPARWRSTRVNVSPKSARLTPPPKRARARRAATRKAPSWRGCAPLAQLPIEAPLACGRPRLTGAGKAFARHVEAE